MKMENLQKIYNQMEDEISKKVFMQRVVYGLSGGASYLSPYFGELDEKMKTIRARLKEGSGKLVIWGAGRRGKELVDYQNDIEWKGFVDNNPNAKDYKGVSICSASEFLKSYNDEIVVISSRLYYDEIYAQLREAGIKEKNIINYGKLLEDLIVGQYFDLDILEFSNEEIFVDVGSWSGETAIILKNKIGDKLKKVIALEPDENRIPICKENMEHAGIKFEIIDKGAWSEDTKLHFSTTGEGMIYQQESGETSIEVIALDNCLNNEKVTFIKMDIEGAEYEALLGCKKTIQTYKPILAISVYHKLDDIIKIPSLIKEICEDYKFYLRQYRPFQTETVLYAIPNKK